ISSAQSEIGNLSTLGTIGLWVPVIRSGNVRYSLVAAIRPSFFAASLDNYGLPEGWRGTIVDGNGAIVGRTAGEDILFPPAGTWPASFDVPGTSGKVMTEPPSAVIEAAYRPTRYIIWLGGAFAVLSAILFSAALTRAWAERRDRARLVEANRQLMEIA